MRIFKSESRQRAELRQDIALGVTAGVVAGTAIVVGSRYAAAKTQQLLEARKVSKALLEAARSAAPAAAMAAAAEPAKPAKAAA